MNDYTSNAGKPKYLTIQSVKNQILVAIKCDFKGHSKEVNMKIRIDPLDKIFSLYIRSRDKVCQRCGGKAQHCAHFHGRSRRSTRWDEDNACALCFGCHQYLDSHPLEKVEFFKSRLTEQKFDMLNSRARIPARYLDKNLLMVYYETKLKEINENLMQIRNSPVVAMDNPSIQGK